MSKPIRLVPEAAQSIEFRCPLCASEHAAYVFGTDRFTIYRCAGCALTFSRPKSRSSDSSELIRQLSRDEKQHGSLIAAIDAAPIAGPVLVLSNHDDGLVSLLKRRGLTIGRVLHSEDLERADNDRNESYSAAILSDSFMRVANPRVALMRIRRLLGDGARLLLSLPLVDGHQARLMGRNWHQWHSLNLWYFSRETLHLLLLSTGFRSVWFEPERRSYSIDTLAERMAGSHAGLPLRILQGMRRLSPVKLRNMKFRLPFGTTVVTATAGPARPEPVVSIVVPVFNEGATVQKMMDALLAKPLPGMRKEIVVVESNSTDGSRELVRTYERHPDVKIVLQKIPRGKGNAVREGISVAGGDILMIQDADLEYDIEDYDGLLAPLIAWQSMFVLGSRHQGGWKMRKFNDAPFTAAVFNLGHTFFRSSMNFALKTRMTDPFTMFKVFRRDALHGLNLVCNRFDFDIELVMKLVRKGYVPVELPVNYIARSFMEGKKVSFTRDGLTWLWTILRFRFSPIGGGRP
jgi:hypothetical protein